MSIQRVVGIDFGTSTSLIKVKAYRDGKPVDGDPTLTHYVEFDGKNMVPTLTVSYTHLDNIITVKGGSDGVLAYADPSHGSSPMVRTEFKAEDKEIASARLYVTAQGIYEIFLNGEQIGDGWFNPGSAEYASTMPYQVYDVTDLLKAGDNTIGAQMGSGWWSGYQTYTASNYNYYGAKQALLAKVDITYGDGTTQTVVTDKDTWKVSTEGPVEYDSFYQGERYNCLLYTSRCV